MTKDLQTSDLNFINFYCIHEIVLHQFCFPFLCLKDIQLVSRNDSSVNKVVAKYPNGKKQANLKSQLCDALLLSNLIAYHIT